jgi:hypothetical protein
MRAGLNIGHIIKPLHRTLHLTKSKPLVFSAAAPIDKKGPSARNT